MIKLKVLSSVLVVSFLMIGCSGGTSSPQVPSKSPQAPSKYSVLQTIPDDGYICKGKSCINDWAKTQLWINKHSYMKIQIMSDYLIQTYSSNSVAFGFTATREPLANDSYKIKLEMKGAGMYGQGNDDKPFVRKAFYYYLKTGKDLLSPIPQEGFWWSSLIR